MWFIFALLAPAFYSVAEIADNFFVNKKFKHPITLVFYSSLFNFLYVPILFFFSHPSMPPPHAWPILILLGLVNVAYLYPYYKGLQSDDTSVVISFLAIERIMVPILAFLIVGEILAPVQYFGIFLIVVSVFLLGLHHVRTKIRFSRGVWYISWAALFLALEAVLLKLAFSQGVTVSTALGGEMAMSLLFGISIFLIPKIRKQIFEAFPVFIKLSPLFLLEEAFTFIGLATEAYAISLTSVSVVKGITMASPFFLILYAWMGSGLFPTFFKEDLHRKKVVHKLFLFAILIIGVILVKE
ncbi:MAG: EamA family transporter [Patescibacteria group bacterium]